MHFETQSRAEQMADSINQVSPTAHIVVKPSRGYRLRHRQDQADPDDPAQWSAPDSVSLYSDLMKGYVIPNSPGEASSLQTRRTLDQYFYAHLDTRKRDKDQVVYRYTRDKLGSQEPKLFMVDQLWLWVLNRGASLETKKLNGIIVCLRWPAEQTLLLVARPRA